MAEQLGFFESAPAAPLGFARQADVLSPSDETELVRRLADLPFREFEFQGFTGKRRVVSFGWRYDFNERTLQQAAEIPEFLLSLRGSAARFAGLDESDLEQVLVTEYSPGAAIGWHRDKGVFGDVVGVSILSECSFRFRLAVEGGWKRASFRLPPRSVYLLRGPSRTEWEHSIPPVDALRYSLTFRTLATPLE